MEFPIDRRMKDKKTPDIKTLGKRRKQILRVLLIVSSAYMLFFLFMILMIYYLNVGYDITRLLQLSILQIAILGCGMYLLFILIIVLLHVGYVRKKKWLEESMKPKPVFYKGKRLYTFTYPPGARGGVYAKTLIDVDDKTAILLRHRIVGPEEIWEDLLS